MPVKFKDFPIGTTYKTRGRHPRTCTVIDIHKTYNHDGDHVKTRYVTAHEFNGQVITESDVVTTTIKMGITRLNADA